MNPKSLHISIGSTVIYQKSEYIVRARPDVGSLYLQSNTGHSQKVSISELLFDSTENSLNTTKLPALENLDDDSWNVVMQKQQIVSRVFDFGESVTKVANEVGIHVTHVYNLRDKYEKFGLEGFIIQSPTGGGGKSRLEIEREKVITDSIKDVYLTKQKPPIAEVVEEVEERCVNLEIKPPARSTIYRRCNAIDEREKAKKRHGKKAHKALTSQIFEGYQDATRPLEVVQIDHTPADVIVVDDETRKPIGRPYLTVAIDVYSRMVIGFLLSLDPPSRMSVALCMQHTLCPKDQWLADREINHSWDIFGVPESIHVDNANEFISPTLRRGCDKYGIGIIYRPVGSAEYGGHVERLIGTINQATKCLPGATFSNIQEKGEYDAEANAALTLSELEQWYGNYFTGKYHKKVHSSLQMNPEQKFYEGMFGCKQEPGAGINQVIIDKDELLMDFIPFDERTVQGYGLQISCIRYNSDELAPFVNMTDPKTGKKMKFVVRRDPRDISEVYFFDPLKKRYITVPYANKARPRMSLRELRWIREELKSRGRNDDVTEDEIFQTRKELKEIVEAAKKETKRARRNRQKGKVHQLTSLASKPTERPAIEDIKDEDFGDDVEAFEDIDLE